ncbi:MAG: hypothetical protein IIA45_09010 [Bacteroidetes bacterium]|nr:hypothetical protein [Bacteroidota bacterium]
MLRSIILIITLTFIFHGDSIAQKKTKIEILNADLLTFKDYGGEKIKRLTGNVRLKHQEVYLNCDSANFYETENLILAFGHVHIKKGDSIDVYADSLKYNGNTKVAELFKNITLTDKKMTLKTDYLIYRTDDDMAIYTNGGTIRDEENVLTSRYGYYYSTTSDIYFKDSVRLINPEYTIICDTLRYNSKSEIVHFMGPSTIVGREDTIYCEHGWFNSKEETSQFTDHATIKTSTYQMSGDTLYFDKKIGFGRAIGNVEWISEDRKTIINGEKAVYYEDHEQTTITGHPLMTTVMEYDSLFMSADTMFSTMDSSDKYRIFHAYHHVKIFKEDFQAICDSLIYTYEDSTFHLYQDPVIWSNESQMNADTIVIAMRNNKMDAIDLNNKAFIISQEDPVLYNQMTGKDIHGYFRDDTLRQLVITGNGQSIYYATDDSAAFIGVNKTICSDIVIYLKHNKIDKVNFLTKPEAVFYPITKIDPEDFRLDGFLWVVEKQPKSKKDLLE